MGLRDNEGPSTKIRRGCARASPAEPSSLVMPESNLKQVVRGIVLHQSVRPPSRCPHPLRPASTGPEQFLWNRNRPPTRLD